MKKPEKNISLNIITIVGAIVFNVLLSYVTYKSGFPMYFDAIGTIGAAAVCGMLPGFLVAVSTNLLCTVFNYNAIYYASLNMLMAAASAFYFQNRRFRKKGHIIGFIFVLSVIAGVFGGIIQIILLGKPQFVELSHLSDYLRTVYHFNYTASFLIINVFLNFIEKGISVGLVILVLKFLPTTNLEGIANAVWKQRPFTDIEMKRMKLSSKKNGNKLQSRVTWMLVVAAVSMTVIMGIISIHLFYSNEKLTYTSNAIGAAKMASNVINGDKVADYINRGHELKDYVETENKLYDIRNNFKGVEYLYVVKIIDKGCQVVFDLATEEVEPYQNGDIIPFEEAFEPYLPALFAGEEIEPIESNDVTGWVITKYYPVKNSAGETVCYVGTDVEMTFISDYLFGYITKTILIFSSFFMLILALGVWLSRYYLVYPINSMAALTNDFMLEGDNQTVLEENVKKIKGLEIKTGDEIENLYDALCRMTENTAEKMKDVRHQAKAINQMQTGLIITMADLVESRDSDTGYHIQKTADYVKIILAGLQKKGYYANKLTPKFIADVEMSAPLHDIGKINIPDAVLNKPGKLTDEEFEIMKTHTTAGKQIMEKAISTVKGESYLKEARNMAAYHHEKWNGTGYPEGLKGEVIPLSARIMAVADVFDALTAKRVYKDPMPFEKAMDIIKKDAGSHFDPKCVEVFVEAEKEVRRVLRKYQD